MSHTPNIRFKGFTDDWEQRKFASVFEGLQNNTLSRAELNYESGTVKNVHYGDVLIKFGDYIDVSETELPYISDDAKADKFKNSFLRDGDIIIADTAEDDTVGKCTEIQGSEGLKLLSGLHTIACRPKEKYGPMFLGYYINSPAYHSQLKPLMQGIKVTSISKSALQDTDMIMPKSVDEQTKIGEYFSNLDNLITLHQRECDKTKDLKKYMLQKMFPKNGESVPEIRFDGFTDPWEQRKLGDVFEQTSNFVNPNEHDIELWSLTVEDGLTPKSERYNREFLVKKEDNFKEVRPGDIVYNPMNMTLGAVGYNAMGKSVAVSGYYTTMIAKENNDAYYINTWLKSPQALLLYKTYATGSLIEKQRVQFPTLSIIPASFPSFAEQQKIGKCFEELDNIITLHQRKCDELKEIKKYMLQNMFPGK